MASPSLAQKLEQQNPKNLDQDQDSSPAGMDQARFRPVWAPIATIRLSLGKIERRLATSSAASGGL